MSICACLYLCEQLCIESCETALRGAVKIISSRCTQPGTGHLHCQNEKFVQQYISHSLSYFEASFTLLPILDTRLLLYLRLENEEHYTDPRNGQKDFVFQLFCGLHCLDLIVARDHTNSSNPAVRFSSNVMETFTFPDGYMF